MVPPVYIMRIDLLLMVRFVSSFKRCLIYLLVIPKSSMAFAVVALAKC